MKSVTDSLMKWLIFILYMNEHMMRRDADKSLGFGVCPYFGFAPGGSCFAIQHIFTFHIFRENTKSVILAWV